MDRSLRAYTVLGGNADTVVIQHARFPAHPRGLIRATLSIVSRTPRQIVETIDSVPGWEIFFDDNVGLVRPTAVPFGRRFVALSAYDRLVFVDTDVPEVKLLGHDLQPRKTIRFEVPPVAITEHMLKSVIDSMAGDLGAIPNEVDWIIRRAHKHFTLAPIEGVHMGPTGEIWTRLALSGEAERAVYHIIDAHGHLCCVAHISKEAHIISGTDRSLVLLQFGDGGYKELIILRRTY